MSKSVWPRSHATAFAIVFSAASLWASPGAGQTVTGQARAVQANVLGPTVLADTGTLGGTTDARDATLDLGIVPSVLTGEVLHAVTIGWPDQVASEASLASLNLAVGGTTISADFVMAQAFAALGSPATATSTIKNLSVNGVAIAVTGKVNQRVPIPGGQLVINEQTMSPSGTAVNAIHATVLGVADVSIAYAIAGIQSF